MALAEFCPINTFSELPKPGSLLKRDGVEAPNVILTWNASNPSECVSGYHVTVKRGSIVVFQGTTSNAPEIIVTGLDAETNYTTEIISTNGKKNSTAAVDWVRTNTKSKLLHGSL